MKQLATIGTQQSSIQYTDRPTVKVIITRGDELLLLNNGLLPGGGIDKGETNYQAITRELQEELGATVRNIKEIGIVTQYRTFLKKRYLVYGFSAELVDLSLETNPQDEGERNFTFQWAPKDRAVEIIGDSIQSLDTGEFTDDTSQGKAYNLQTTLEFLKAL